MLEEYLEKRLAPLHLDLLIVTKRLLKIVFLHFAIWNLSFHVFQNLEEEKLLANLNVRISA